MEQNEIFDNFLTERNDEIDGAAYELLISLAETEVEWDMEMIGDLVDCAKKILAEHNIDYCHPFYEGDDQLPCCLGKECPTCDCEHRKS